MLSPLWNWANTKKIIASSIPVIHWLSCYFIHFFDRLYSPNVYLVPFLKETLPQVWWLRSSCGGGSFSKVTQDEHYNVTAVFCGGTKGSLVGEWKELSWSVEPWKLLVSMRHCEWSLTPTCRVRSSEDRVCSPVNLTQLYNWHWQLARFGNCLVGHWNNT